MTPAGVIAVVAASGPAGDADHGSDAGGRPTALRLWAVTADAGHLTAVRHEVVRWAQAARLSAEQLQDLGLAVYEAMANVVDHAYRRGVGVFDVHAVDDEDAVTVTVADHGRWQEPASSQENLRGRGLRLIKQLTTEFEVRVMAQGTLVRMRWRHYPGATAPSV